MDGDLWNYTRAGHLNDGYQLRYLKLFTKLLKARKSFVHTAGHIYPTAFWEQWRRYFLFLFFFLQRNSLFNNRNWVIIIDSVFSKFEFWQHSLPVADIYRGCPKSLQTRGKHRITSPYQFIFDFIHCHNMLLTHISILIHCKQEEKSLWSSLIITTCCWQRFLYQILANGFSFSLSGFSRVFKAIINYWYSIVAVV